MTVDDVEEEESVTRWYGRWKFTFLLVSLVALVILQSFFEGLVIHRLSVHLGYSLVMIATVFAFARTPRLRAILMLLAIVAMIGTWSVFWYHGTLARELVLADKFLAILFLGLTTTVVLDRVLTDRTVTIDTLVGSVCVYLLIGALWAVLYESVALLDNQAFDMPGEMKAELSHSWVNINDWLYYSFMTLTLGVGDIVPRSRAAGTFTWLEAMAGQFYLAVLVARLVGLHTAPAAAGRKA